jgi:hypothetical protein
MQQEQQLNRIRNRNCDNNNKRNRNDTFICVPGRIRPLRSCRNPNPAPARGRRSFPPKMADRRLFFHSDSDMPLPWCVSSKYRLVSWLVGWLVGWLISWLVG